MLEVKYINLMNYCYSIKLLIAFYYYKISVWLIILYYVCYDRNMY